MVGTPAATRLGRPGRLAYDARVPPAPRRSRDLDVRVLPVHAAGSVPVPYVIAGMDEQVGRETVWDAHAHPTHELSWTLRGASGVTVGDRTWAITPSIGLWLPAGTVHSGHAPPGTWYRTAQFGVHAVAPLADGPVAVEITPLLGLLLDRLTGTALTPRSRELTEQLVLDVLEPSPHAVAVQLPTTAVLRPVVAALDADPADRRSLAEWAAELGVSPRTLTRAFRAGTGLSFGRWRSAVRAHHAVLLLAAGEPVEDVAEAVGYRSASAFGAAFRQEVGLTPGRFRPAGTTGPARPDLDR